MNLVSKNVTSFPQSSFNWEQFCTLCSLYDRFICQFGFMEPIKQTVENDLDSLTVDTTTVGLVLLCPLTKCTDLSN